MFIKLLVINAGNCEEIVCDADEEEEEEEEEREREREREIHTVPTPVTLNEEDSEATSEHINTSVH